MPQRAMDNGATLLQTSSNQSTLREALINVILSPER